MAALNTSPFGPPTDPTTAPLRMFGGPRLLLAEEEVKLSPFQASLMAIVCMHEVTGVSRARVSWLLWESEDDAPARHRISQLLYGIGSRAGMAAILAEGDDLKPSPELESDLGRLRITRATRPVTGAPLGRLCAPHPTGAFEEWLTTQRTTLRYLAIERNGELLAAAEETHEYELAAEAARALLEYDPINERGLRSLIRAVALGGSALQAEAAYDRQAEVVRRILPDWKPSRETRRLLGEIDSLRARQAAPPTTRDIQHSVRMVGRKEELTELRQACVEDGVPWRDVMILGEAGIGKSRLLEELARQLDLEDCRVVRIRSFAAEEGIAFNLLSEIARTEPFQEAIRTLAPLWRKILSSALSIEPVDVPEEDLPEVPADSASRRVYEALRHLFDAVEGPVVILADGFGAADSSSLAALSFLRRRVKGSTIRFIGTVGQDTVYGDPGQRRYLQDVLDQVDHKVELEPLDEEEAVKLVEAAGGGDSDLPRRRIAALSGGNPLLVIELSQSSLDLEDNTIPPTLQALLSRRFRSLSGRTRALLELLSAQRQSVSLQLLADVGGLSLHEALTGLDEAQSRRLVALDKDGVTFRHGLFREWIYQGLSSTEREFIHARTYEAILASEGENSPVDLALHAYSAGNTVAAYKWAKTSAQRALNRSAFPHVIQFLTIAADTADQAEERWEALARAGELLYLQGSLKQAMELLEDCLGMESGISSNPRNLQARTTFFRAGAEIGEIPVREADASLKAIQSEALSEGVNEVGVAALDARLVLANENLDFEQVHLLLAVAESLQSSDNLEVQCRLELLKAFNFLYRSRAEGIRSADEALQLSLEEALEHLRPSALARYLIVHSWVGDLTDEEVVRLLSLTEESARRTGDQRQLLRALINLSTWYLDLLQPEKALPLLEQSEKLIETADPELRASLDVNWGEYFLSVGEYVEALTAFENGCRRAAIARPDVYCAAWAGYGLASIETGSVAKAMEASGKIPSNDQLLGGVINFDPSLIVRLRVRLHELEGASGAALQLLRSARHALRGRHIPSWLGLALQQAKFLKKRRTRATREEFREELEKCEELGFVQIEKKLSRYLHGER